MIEWTLQGPKTKSYVGMATDAKRKVKIWRMRSIKPLELGVHMDYWRGIT